MKSSLIFWWSLRFKNPFSSNYGFSIFQRNNTKQWLSLLRVFIIERENDSEEKEEVVHFVARPNYLFLKL